MTENKMNIARPEKGFLLSSDQGAVDGCVGCSRGGPGVNIARSGYSMDMDKSNHSIQTGGYHYSPVFKNNPPMGPNGGLMNYTRGENCGTVNPLNLNASKQHSGDLQQQKGGNKQGVLSQSISRYGVENISQNEANILRGSYAPVTASSVSNQPYHTMKGGSNKDDVCQGIYKIRDMYKKELVNLQSSLTSKDRKMIEIILNYYTNISCDVLQARKSTNKEYVQRKINDIESNYQKLQTLLNNYLKNNKNRKEKEDIKNIYKYIQKLIKDVRQHYRTLGKEKKPKTLTKKSKTPTKKPKTSKKKEKNKRRKSIKMRRRKRRKTMKGGYHQYQSNVANTPSMSIPNGSGQGGLFANPPSYKMINNCHSGSYNHYTGEQKPMPILEQDVMQN